MASIFEKYRPQTLDDVVGQPKAVELLRRVPAGGNAFLFAGSSGRGKTTLARIVASSIAEPWHVEEIDAQDCSLDYLRGMERGFAYRGMGQKTGKAWIFNEIHGMRGPIVSRFLTLLEAMPDHCTIIFTTTKKPEAGLFEELNDADPFFSRCLVVPMQVEARPIAERVRSIAQAEGLDGKPIEAYVKLAFECNHNIRMMLGRIQAGAMLD